MIKISENEEIGMKYRVPSYGKEVVLTLIEDVDGDTGRGISRLDTETRNKLNVKLGDYIEVLGPKTFKLKVEQLETDKKSVITISKDLREKIPLSVGVKVFVRKSIL